MKNIFVILLIVSTLATSTPLYATGAPVVETGPSLANSIRGIIKDFHLDKLPIKIAKKLLEKMTDSVVVWAAGGFKKEGPAFISNYSDYAAGLAIETGTLLIDEVVGVSEKYASTQLTAEEKQLQRACVENEKRYKEFYDPIRTGLLESGIDIGYTNGLFSLQNNGETAFNSMMVNLNYPPYVIGPGQYNENALEDFIQEVIMRDRVNLAATGLIVDYDVLQGIMQEQENCRKTLLLKVAGLTYTNDLVKFVGEVYRNGRKGSAASLGVPNFENFGSAYTKALSENWKSFQTDASRGGWAAYGEAIKLENTPLGAKYQTQLALSDDLAQKLAQKTVELSRSGGFLDKGECAQYKPVKVAGETEQVCIDYQANTPGSVIREAINKRVLNQYDQLNNVSDWSQLLLTTGVKLVSGILEEGVLPLANNAIDKGLACLAGSCQEDAFGQSNVASSQTISNSGNALGFDDIVDIQSVLYGPLVLEKDENGNALYERTDASGNRIREQRSSTGSLVEFIAYATAASGGTQEGDIVYRIRPVVRREGGVDITYYVPTTLPNGSRPFDDLTSLEPTLTIDYSRPQYALDTVLDSSGNPTGRLQYETHGRTGALLFDQNGKKIPKYKRANGSIQLAEDLRSLLVIQYTFVRGKGVKKLMEFDHALPGPDLGWKERLEELSGNLLGEYSNVKERNALKEILDKVENKFEAGFYGYMLDDSLDIALVREGSVYTNPDYTFTDFAYPRTGPGTLSIDSNGAPLPQTGVNASNYQSLLSTTFPKKLNLTLVGDTAPREYDVVSMNTSAGLWFNPVSNQIEAVGNIPDAAEMRELATIVQAQYTDVMDTFNRRGNEIVTILAKLRELRSRYQSLPYIGNDSTLEQRIQRTKLENDIAYEISLIRDKLPIYDEVQEVRSALKNILVTYDKMSEMIEGTNAYRQSDGYATRFGDIQQYRGEEESDEIYRGYQYYIENPIQLQRYRDLYLKDKMGILYCGFQDHSIVNSMGAAVRQEILEEFVRNSVRANTSRFVESLFGNNQQIYNVFGGFASVGIGTAEYRSTTMRSATYEYVVPYRCYETSVVCTENGGEAPCTAFQCPIGGHNTPGESFLMATMKIPCKNIYKSSVGDYLQIIDSNSR